MTFKCTFKCTSAQRTFAVGAKNHCTACRSQHKKIGFDKKENMWLLVGSETVESKPVKLETSRKGESPLSYDQCDQIA